MTKNRASHLVALPQSTGKLKPYDRARILLRYNLLAANDRGSSMVFALIFVFVVLTTSLMVSNRGMFGMIGSVFNQDSKLARDAADIGILRAVITLNEPQNRYLLVNADDIDNATASDIKTNDKYSNPCLDASSPNDPPPRLPEPDVVNSSFPLKSSIGASYPTIDIDDGTASRGIQRKFKVLSISQQGLPNADTGGGIRITV